MSSFFAPAEVCVQACTAKASTSTMATSGGDHLGARCRLHGGAGEGTAKRMDPTEAEKSGPMIPVSSLPNEPKKTTAKSKPKHPDEPTRATAPAIQPAAAKATSKPPQPPIQVTGTVTKGGRTVKPNSLV
jgi:hypothetical protein